MLVRRRRGRVGVGVSGLRRVVLVGRGCWVLLRVSGLWSVVLVRRRSLVILQFVNTDVCYL